MTDAERDHPGPRAYKVSDSQVRWIRRIYRPGQQGRSMRALATKLGVSTQYVSDIINGKRRYLVKGRYDG